VQDPHQRSRRQQVRGHTTLITERDDTRGRGGLDSALRGVRHRRPVPRRTRAGL